MEMMMDCINLLVEELRLKDMVIKKYVKDLEGVNNGNE
jgi:hypothetical protein